MTAGLAAQWQAVSRLLDAALDLPAAQRQAWLDGLGAEFAEAKPHLVRLLAQHAEGEVELGDVLPPYYDAQLADDGLVAGATLGGYRLLRSIGRGGMGSVWLAEPAAEGARLPVALKVLRTDSGSASLVERFRREQHILAALNHPNIARLIDSGVTPEGRPWLAIEYVEGGTVLDYCAANKADLRTRITLFLQALKAIQYAHSSLVIHRDLKPANILVTPTGEVKLLDFGIAKLLEPGSTQSLETELTRAAGRVMTPHYASPEQVAGLPLTTASDVYSLGVVFFELLTGTRPYRLRRGTAAELEEAILAADTALPSAAVAEVFAQAVPSGPGRWRRALRGDLDTIALKALAKSPADRYATADAFAQDLERYLAGMPVHARRESLAYRAAKFVARNRLAVGAAAAIGVALLAGLFAAMWQANAAREQARVAREEAQKSRAIQAFLVSIFEKNSRNQASAAKSRNQTAREVLLEAAARMPGAFADAPALKAELLVTVGSLLLDVDESAGAAKLFREAAALSASQGPKAGDTRIEALLGLAQSARMQGLGSEGLQARDEAIALLDARGDRESLLRARAAAHPVAAQGRDWAKERALVADSVRFFAERHPRHPDRFMAVMTYAQLHRVRGDLPGALALFREALALFEPVGSRDYLNLSAAHAWAGFCAFRVGLMREALVESETGVRLLGQQAGEQALPTRFHRGLHAEILHRNGQREGAFRLFEELRRTVPGAAGANEFNNALYEADAHLREGRPGRAIELLEPFAATLPEFGRRYYPNGVHWATLLARAHAVRGDGRKAEAALRRIDDVPRNHGSSAAQQIQYVLDVAWVRYADGRLDDAWKALTVGDGKLSDPEPVFSYYDPQMRAQASRIAAARGDAALAIRHADEGLAYLRAKAEPGAFPWLEADGLAALGEAHLAAGDGASALAALEPALQAQRRLQDAASPWLADTLVSVAHARALQGDPVRARAHLAEARGIYARNPVLHPRFAARLKEVAARVA